MALFKVHRTFSLKSLNYFVISGEIISGEIKNGMALNFKNKNQEIIKFPIHKINYLDKMVAGHFEAETALCIKVSKAEYLEVFKDMKFENKVFRISHLKIKKKSIENELKVTFSSQGSWRLHTKLIKGKGFHPGHIYNFHVKNSNVNINAFYTKKGLQYYTFIVVGHHGNIQSGTTIESSELITPHKQD